MTYRTLDEKLLGHPNDPLPNMKEITLADLAQSMFFTYSPVGMGYRQITVDRMQAAGLKPNEYLGRPQFTPIRYWQMHDGTGYAMGADYWGKTVRFFKWALCEHTLVGVPEESRMCWHVRRCSKCGYKQEVDSSD